MSIKHVNEIARGAFGIDPTAKLVLMILAVHADDNGTAWPSVATIAQLACISEDRAKHVLQRLQHDEWIVLESKGRGPGRTSRRRLNLSKLVRNRVADDTISVTQNVSSTTRLRNENVSPTVENVSLATRERVAGDTRTIKNLQQNRIAPNEKISFDAARGWQGITDEDRWAWADLFSSIDVDEQLALAHDDVKSNPELQNQNRDWRRFLVERLRYAHDPEQVLVGR